MNIAKIAMNRSLMTGAATFLSYQGGKFVCDRLLKRDDPSKQKNDIFQTAMEWAMPLVSLVPLAIPSMPLIGGLALGAGTGIAISLIHYAREKFSSLKKDKNDGAGGSAPDHIDIPDDTELPFTPIPAPKPRSNPKPVAKPTVQPVEQPNLQKDKKSGAYSCKPEVAKKSYAVEMGYRKGYKIVFDCHTIKLPFKKSFPSRKIYAISMADFAEKASDKEILAVWDTIKNALPDREKLESHGAYVNFKIYKGKFLADILVPRKNGKKIQLGSSKQSELYKKSQEYKKDKIREHKEGFTQFAALERQPNDSWENTGEDLICPTVPQKDNRNLDHYQDLSTFLNGATDDEKVRFFRRCAGATEKQTEDEEEVYFHLGNLRSQPYLHAHIKKPNRDYSEGK